MYKRIDWHSHMLKDSTRIDSNYKNTQNVRRYFRTAVGEHFYFDRPFMKYLKVNQGITLKQAVAEWKRRHKEVQ